jgi:hypothetical protein
MNILTLNLHLHGQTDSIHYTLRMPVSERAEDGLTPQLLRSIATQLDARATVIESARRAERAAA